MLVDLEFRLYIMGSSSDSSGPPFLRRFIFYDFDYILVDCYLRVECLCRMRAHSSLLFFISCCIVIWALGAGAVGLALRLARIFMPILPVLHQGLLRF